MDDIVAWQQSRLQQLEQFLHETLTQQAGDEFPRLHEAMSYSVLSGGKRIRALLVYATGYALNVPEQRLTPVAAALECIHAYSLIHDDLPAMDDDELRRGKPTNHIAFDEATAILAGDALQTLAFELVSSPSFELDAEQRLKITHQLALSAGRNGMVGGQMLDIQATGKLIDLDQLKTVHAAKTGALIKAAVVCGALCAPPDRSESVMAKLEQYAEKIGLAFQVMDDVLDETSDTETLGKLAGADRLMDKSTYPALLGLQESQDLAEKLLQEALESIQAISDNTDPLEFLAQRIVNRSH